ncbi:MAG: hypothetical protein EAZ85_00190 [Bacteroidetes bacterium]|nr:MAG: hypothetical protein EAZ85_00190 [Bacteroidota bacterium]TAG90572.1 MAG: hypothetical protein EAZ20_04095 [Bacteroidota bacterium]
MTTPKDIITKYPFLKTNDAENIIMGDDIDAALSCFLYLSQNPNAKLVGIYHQYKKIYFNATIVSKKELGNCIYIDLDIYHQKCRSLGHHIVRLNKENKLQGFQNSCNLNELKGFSIENNFTKKFPLGTIHFLLWLYQIDIPSTNWAKYLIWLADSTFINGQNHRFPKNVITWINLFPVPALVESFAELDTEIFEEKMEELQQILSQKNFEQGEGQVKSKHKQLTGFQCQPKKNANAEELSVYIQKIFQMIEEMTNWQIKPEQICVEDMEYFSFKRKTEKIENVLKDTNLDDFLIKNKVFSYVFPFKDSINYTHF